MTSPLLRAAVALVSGAVFGLGLSLSGMLDPARVQGFLDVFGNWDPSLAFVLGGAVGVAIIGVAIMGRMAHPMLDTAFYLPSATTVDARLIVGSVVFGVGWGLAGFCPGPALAVLSLGLTPTSVFVLAMIAGMVLHDRFLAGRAA